MKMRSDKYLSLLYLLLAILLIEESWRLGVGELRKPGSGLFPLLIGMFLLIVSFLLFLQTRSHGTTDKEGTEKVRYRNILLCISALYAFILVLEWLGFIVSTFFLILFLLKAIEHKGWRLAITTALLTAAVSYAFFGIALRAALPRGILGI
jgi:putative tricarboxylic transport membrane protein